MNLTIKKISLILLTTVAILSCSRTVDQKLVDAAADGDLERVVMWVDSGANVNARERDDWTPLAIASREGHLKVVEFLLEKGAEINEHEGGGHTALFWAKKYNREAVVKALTKHGAKDE